jgi:hypothetical protein
MEFTDKQKERFWNKVDKTDSCWLWTGCIVDGYGQVSINDKMYKTHRISWLLSGNMISNGHVIRHKCRSRNCVNPEHLETGTQADNQADKIRDGTSTRGEKHGRVKLTTSQVLEIRERAIENHYKLAEEYRVTQGTIWQIINRHTWKHLVI